MKEIFLNQMISNESVAKEILEYTQNVYRDYIARFDHSQISIDEPYIKNWEAIVKMSGMFGVQYAFNNGDLPFKGKVLLSRPDLSKIYIHSSFAGRVPVIFTSAIEDFEEMLAQIVFKGEHVAHIKNMGASFLHGKSNAFIILSGKPYSNIPSSALGLDDSVWSGYSAVIRREHECFHFFTKRFLGGTRNHIHDELIADFVGIMAATGSYNPEWFLKFLGIEKSARAETVGRGRYAIYTEKLSAEASEVIAEIARRAVYTVEESCRVNPKESLLSKILWLCGKSLLELAFVKI